MAAAGRVQHLSPMSQGYVVIHTATGLRLKQHGVVLSEMRSEPGPTHSVFDVLASLAQALQPGAPIALLGFAGGGVMAPLRALNRDTLVTALDLEPSGYALFRQQSSAWAGPLFWQQADALKWLRGQTRRWPVIIDDLSVVSDRRVVKPDACYTVLPRLIRGRLQRQGVAICNLLCPRLISWSQGLAPFTRSFPSVHIVHLREFENRILVAGDRLPSTRQLGSLVRHQLKTLGSRQATRLHIQRLA
jgi:hypothetical protein